MLQRKSIANEQHTTAVRRSPRFLPPETLDPKTPNPDPRRYRALHSASVTPLSSTPKGAVNSGNQLRKSEVSKKEKGSNVDSKSGAEPNSGLRRSARLSGIFCKQESSSNASEFGMRSRLGRDFSCSAEKRVTRSSSRVKNDEAASKRGNKKSSDGLNQCNSGKNLKGRVMVDEGKATSGVNLSKEFVGNVEKRVTRGRKSTSAKGVPNEGSEKGGLLDEGKAKNGTKLSTPSLVERAKEGNADRGKKQIGAKRKRDQNEEECLIVKGWTKEQELALQKAYFAAKPTPNFWKKVSKMVPGKTAQECFNKVHSDHLTPRQAQPRSRAKNITPSPLSYSASKLLNSTEPKMKKCRYSKHNNHLAQKTVRHLLQKQYNVDQEEQPDLFALLEETVDPSTGASQQCPIYSTPEHNKGGFSFLKKCRETSSSAHRKHLSRLSISSGASLISPPVLKQIKNKALHEKYIDQLHCREAKRKAALARAAKQVKNKRGVEESHVAKLDALKEAKSALFFDARDAISQFQHLQTTAIDDSDHSDDDVPNSEDDEGEDGP